MSVAIATLPAKPPAATSNTSATPATSATSADTQDATTPSADFARLLRGQLAAEASLQPGLPEGTPAQTDGNTATELAPQDAAMLLATLGIPGNQAVPKPVDVQLPGKTENAPQASIRGTEESASLKDAPANLLATGAGSESKDRSGGFIASTGLDADDKAAKFAVADFSLPKTETPAVTAGQRGETPATTVANIALSTPVPPLHNESTLKVGTPVHDHAWAGDFSQKIVWLANNDKQTAQLTLNPPQMGPIEISLNINKDSATAFFVSQNAEVREAIETALPRLREMLAGVGIELGQANVSAESFRQQAGSEEARQGTPRWKTDNAILGGDSVRALSGQTIITQRGNSLVDTFA